MVRPSGKGVQTNIKNIIDWMEGKREFFSSFEICDILEEKKFSAHFQKFPDQSAYNWLARLTTRSPPSHCPSPSTLHLALLRQLARISSSVYWLCPVNSIPPSLIKQVVQPRNLVERDKWSGITISDSLRKSLLFHANSLLFAISSDRKFLNTRSTYFYIIFSFFNSLDSSQLKIWMPGYNSISMCIPVPTSWQRQFVRSLLILELSMESHSQ